MVPHRYRAMSCCLSIAVCLTPWAVAAVDQGPGGAMRIAVGAVSGQVETLERWDPASPQRLVRIEGALFQEDAGFYYRVVPDRLTVRLADGIESWQQLLDRALAREPQAFGALSSLEALGQNRLGIVDLATPRGADLAGLCELIFRTGLVRYAELASYGVWTATPNDPRYPEQWALNNTGQTGGTPGADVDAEAAWDLTAGDFSTIVAVIDSGTDVDHEDLALNVWHNEDETPGNGIDDDGNGYIDDWEGWDFDNNNNDPRSGYFHGTHVTGIVNAATNNGIGIAGLAGGFGGQGVAGMALGVGESAPNGNVLDDAILYAADNGADVITLSLSVSETQAINDALDYAYNTKDVFIDCAAGNSGSSVSYPARRPEVMSVASTDHNDAKSGFSNPGPENEVAAPGSSILSTQIGDAYGTSSGTSFAAPHVAAVAGLIRSRNPGLPAPEVRQILIDSAEDVGPAGFDNGTGWGRVNAFEAVTLAADSDGIVRLNKDVYSCSDELVITVSDIDLAGDGTTVVTVTSDTETGGESVALDERGEASGVFRGSLPTGSGAPAADGVLQIVHGDGIVVEYIDADDGKGGTNLSKTDTAVADCKSPLTSDVDAVDINDTSARIVWTTDELSTSLVRYGPVPPPSSEKSVSGLVLEHSVTLTGLTDCTIYKYEVESADAQANLTVDDNGGQYYTFETYGNFPDIGVIPCHRGEARLDTDPYDCDDTVTVTVTDIDLNADPGQVETVTVLMTSSSEPEGEWITLTELDADNSRFSGEIQLDTGTASEDGLLQVTPDDLISVTYYDEDDGEGRPRQST
ncbi:MAG: S8 family serine peptidase, partial [Acidobacteriota bacterium]